MDEGHPPFGEVGVEEKVGWQPRPATQVQYQPPAGAPPTDPPPPPPPPPPQYGPPHGYGPYYAPPPPARAGSSKTIVGIVIGVIAACVLLPVLGIIIAIVVPLSLSARNNAVNEQARDTLRTVISAEASYYEQEKHYGTLTELVQAGCLDERFSTGDLGGGVSLSLSVDDEQTGYYAEAHTATITYSADESGEIQSS